MTPTIFDFNHYSDNPIVDFCLKSYPKKNILREKDIKDELKHCKHSQWAFDNRLLQFAGDELRLFLASISDDFTYVDADSRVLNLKDLKLHSCCLEQDGSVNDGSYFRGNKDTKWIKHYLNVYETFPEKEYKLVNYDLHKKYPTIVPTQQLSYTHYYMSWFSRMKKKIITSTLNYTLFEDRAIKEIMKGNNVLLLGPNPGDVYYSRYGASLWKYYLLPFDLLQKQLDFTCGRHIELVSLD